MKWPSESGCLHEWEQFCKSREFDLWLYRCRLCGIETPDVEYYREMKEHVQNQTERVWDMIKRIPSEDLRRVAFFCWIVEDACTADRIKTCYSLLQGGPVGNILPAILLNCQNEKLALIWLNRKKQYHELLESPRTYASERCDEIKESILNVEYKQWTLTKKDIENASFILQSEMVDPLTIPEMFKAALWTILSATERFDKQVQIYSSFLNRKLDTPQRIQENWNQVRLLIGKTRFPNQREKRFRAFIKWWESTDIPTQILHDATNGKEREIELRNELAKYAPGIGPKCASLFMIKCGYRNIVPIDIWIIRYLKAIGCKIEEPDYKRVSGLTDKEYRKYEEIIRGIAKSHNLSPALFQAALWGKNSMWSKSPLDPSQNVIEDFGGGLCG